MVIQRIQSLYLLLASILMIVFAFMPVIELRSDAGVFFIGALPLGKISMVSYVLLCLDVLISVLSVIVIFMYKNLKQQIKVTNVLLLLVVALLVTIGVMMVTQHGHAVAIMQWPIAFPFVSMVLVMMASKGMKHDKKLLSDSERIR